MIKIKFIYNTIKHIIYIFIYIFSFLYFSVEISDYQKITSNQYTNVDLKTYSNGDIIIKNKNIELHYYNQTDSRWANEIYGDNDVISIYGCGPTVLSMIVTSIAKDNITPDKMAKWAYDNGYFCNGSGSYHSIIPMGLSQWGFDVNPLTEYTNDAIKNTLLDGNILVALMGNGHFTQKGHFIIIYGISENNNLLIADPVNTQHSLIEWESEIIINEAKYNSGNGGPFWIISKQ